MARSHYEFRHPGEASARVSACMTLGLDYNLKCFTADDGEMAFILDIPELDMADMFRVGPTPVMGLGQPTEVKKIDPPKPVRLSREEITRLLQQGGQD